MCISTGAINPKLKAHFGYTGSLDQWDLDRVLAEFDIDGSEHIEKSEFARLYSLVHISPLEAAPGSLGPMDWYVPCAFIWSFCVILYVILYVILSRD